MDGTLPTLILLAWPVVVLGLFLSIPASRAVVVALFAAWLFLPVAAISLPGIPDYNKMSATMLGIVIGTAFADPGRLASLRPRWYDVPLLMLIVSPFFSSVDNGFGYYEGLSWSFRYAVTWGMPYLVGRCYFSTAAEMTTFVKAMVIAALIYTPLVLFEARMSPQLHRWVYGYFPGNFYDAKRMGGFRPFVFMEHGMMLGMFMCSAALAAVWLLRAKLLPAVTGIPAGAIAALMVLTGLLCRSAGALALCVYGWALLVITAIVPLRLWLTTAILVPVGYILARTLGGWRGQELIDLSAMLFGEERADSLWTRLNSESQLWELAQPKLLFGAGRFEFVGMQLEGSNKGILADGLWIIFLGRNGVFGLVAMFTLLLLPPLLFVLRVPADRWKTSEYAAPAVAAAMCTVYAYDCVLNAMINPIFIVALGGLAAVGVTRVQRPVGGVMPAPVSA